MTAADGCAGRVSRTGGAGPPAPSVPRPAHDGSLPEDRTPGQDAGRDPGGEPAPDAGELEEPGMAERRRIAVEQGRRRFAALERMWGRSDDPPGHRVPADGAMVEGPQGGRQGMRRSELVRLVGLQAGLYPAAADAAVKAVFEEVAGALARGEAVQLVGFGSFAAKHCPARTGRNPRTGAPIAVPASRAVSFRAGKGLQDAVNRKTG